MKVHALSKGRYDNNVINVKRFYIQGSYARTKLNRIRNRFQILQNHNRENNSPVDEQWGRDREISKTKGKILHRVLG